MLLTLFAIGFGNFSQWCATEGQMCFRTAIDRMIPEFTYPLYFFALFFLPLALILIFVPRHIFVSWLKFALWALPLSFIFIMTTPVNWTGIGLDLFPFYRDDAARLAGQAFAVISALLVVWKYIVARRTKSARD